MNVNLTAACQWAIDKDAVLEAVENGKDPYRLIGLQTIVPTGVAGLLAMVALYADPSQWVVVALTLFWLYTFMPALGVYSLLLEEGEV